MIAVTYVVTLDEPLLATTLNGDPNSAVSASYIPGSMMRGMLIARHAAKGDLAISARDLFFSGQIRFLHAYPAHPNRIEGRRSLPLPASWRREKTDVSKQNTIEDWALLGTTSSKLGDPTAVTGEFTWLDANSVVIKTPPTQITVHTQRARGAGRATREKGAVYRYEALAEDEQFAGAILCDNARQAELVESWLGQEVAYVGGAQTAGYGRVRIDNVEIWGLNDEDELWSEYACETEAVASGGSLVITLLSDTILRNPNGTTYTDLLAALDLPLILQQAFKSVITVGGFNRKWGLPLPQTKALKAGSVFVCSATREISPSELEQWRISGVGERCVEGYGRIAFNWQTEKYLEKREAAKPRQPKSQLRLPSDTSDPVHQLAKRMVLRRQRQLLDEKMIQVVHNLEIHRAPPNSQLSAIRVIARHALHVGDLARISNLFSEKIDGIDNPNVIKLQARTKYERARIEGGVRLSDWISALADTPHKVWDKLGYPAKSLGDIQPGAELAPEYAVRLIDAVLAKAMKSRRNQQNKQGGDANGTA